MRTSRTICTTNYTAFFAMVSLLPLSRCSALLPAPLRLILPSLKSLRLTWTMFQPLPVMFLTMASGLILSFVISSVSLLPSTLSRLCRTLHMSTATMFLFMLAVLASDFWILVLHRDAARRPASHFLIAMVQHFEPKEAPGPRDMQLVEQFAAVDLRVASETGVVEGNASALDEMYNGIENPASILGKPDDVFAAYRMQSYVHNSGAVAPEVTPPGTPDA